MTHISLSSGAVSYTHLYLSSGVDSSYLTYLGQVDHTFTVGFDEGCLLYTSNTHVQNPHFTDANFTLVIYGPVVNPQVIIGDKAI